MKNTNNFFTKHKKMLTNDEGATSVLVIFMMIVLVTLGTFALTSANVNYKLSKKTLAWSKNYYALDSKGENFTGEVDSALSKAEFETVSYIQSEAFTLQTYDDVDSVVQNEIYKSYLNSTNKDTIVSNVAKNIYMFYATKELQVLTTNYPKVQILPNTVNSLTDAIVITNDFNSDDNDQMNLTVSLNVNSFNYDVKVQNGAISGVKKESDRFDVLSWRQWNTPQEFDNSQEIWDGSFGSGDDNATNNAYDSNNSENSQGTDIFGN